MSGTRLTIDPDSPQDVPAGRVDHEVLDATGEEDIARQARDDDAEAMRDMGRFARRVRRRLGLTQVEFARRIDVPHETIRNWEQGKRGPTGAARASGSSTRRRRRRCACLGDAGAAKRATVTVSGTPTGRTARSAEWTRHLCNLSVNIRRSQGIQRPTPGGHARHDMRRSHRAR